MLVFEVVDEPRLCGGQADLGAERGQLLLALLPRQQVLGPVGVLVRADDGDVAGAQLLGQVAEHHRLEVAPVHHARVLAVAHHAPPVARREADPRLRIVLLGRGRQRDEIAPLARIGAGVLQGGQHRVVGGGRLQLQLGG